VQDGLYRLLRRALELPDGRRLHRTLAALRRLADGDCGTVRIQTAVRQFLHHVGDYRAYLAHPALGLPRTTSAVESLGRILRELFRSSRAGSSPASVQLWASALIRLRPQVACHAHVIDGDS
jgi:hypothetical protein